MKHPQKLNSSEIEQIQQLKGQLSGLLEPDFSSLVLSSVAGTRTSNSRYHCAIFTAEKLSLVERSSKQSTTFEFNFGTETLETDAVIDPGIVVGTFTQKLSELIQKAQTGKATLKKNH
ncbi:hypothetical protein EBR57_03805 [bacterium]|nr:hypothetical protein [bacterium]